MYQGFIVQINKLNKHPNADRLQIADIYGDSIIVGLDVKIGDIGVYFPVGGQLSARFCDENHLCRKNSQGLADTGYLDGDKRNITAIRLRGEKSEGLYVPISAFNYLGVNWDIKDVGTPITVVNGEEICKKYIPRGSHRRSGGRSSKTVGIKKEDIAPIFYEHADTEQLAYNLNSFKPDDLIEITLKMHGTSQRTGYLPVLKGYKTNNFISQYAVKSYMKNPTGVGKIIKKLALDAIKTGTPQYDWKYISGTRRTVLNDWEGGFYGSNAFRKQHADFFEGKLHKGETVYYEVVGFTDTGAPIMPSASNKGLDTDFRKMYGETTTFSYGCLQETTIDARNKEGVKLLEFPHTFYSSDFYVYRMTMVNEDGDVVEYSPDYMRYRCEQMGCKTVPVFWKGYLKKEDIDKSMYKDTGEFVKVLTEQFYDGPDPVGKTHVREGVVVRIVNRPKFTAYKHKNFSFKVLSGIAIDKLTESGEVDNLSDDVISEL